MRSGRKFHNLSMLVSSSQSLEIIIKFARNFFSFFFSDGIFLILGNLKQIVTGKKNSGGNSKNPEIGKNHTPAGRGIFYQGIRHFFPQKSGDKLGIKLKAEHGLHSLTKTSILLLSLISTLYLYDGIISFQSVFKCVLKSETGQLSGWLYMASIQSGPGRI